MSNLFENNELDEAQKQAEETARVKVKGQYAEVEELVRQAMRKQDVATYYERGSDGMDIVARETAKQIMDVFYPG